MTDEKLTLKEVQERTADFMQDVYDAAEKRKLGATLVVSALEAIKYDYLQAYLVHNDDKREVKKE